MILFTRTIVAFTTILNVLIGSNITFALDDACTTPDNVMGTCINIHDCKSVVDVIEKSQKPLSRSLINRLQSYQCSNENTGIKVCCPSVPILATPPQPTDVSQHKNLKLLPEDCGYLNIDEKIVGGNKTGLFEFPWMVLLAYKADMGPEFLCGGTVINDRYILTAAHCVTNLKYPLLHIRVGEHDIRTEEDCETIDGEKQCAPPYKDVRIEEVIPNEQFDSTTLANDIALLRVSRLDITQKHIKAVCLPLEHMRTYNFTDRNALVTGWGATEDGNSSPELLKVEVPVLSADNCHEIYYNTARITYRQLCAGGRNWKDSCGGDSGGPLHVAGILNDDTRYVQQGIVSFGPKICGVHGKPGVYTKVAYYMDWILNKIKP